MSSASAVETGGQLGSAQSTAGSGSTLGKVKGFSPNLRQLYGSNLEKRVANDATVSADYSDGCGTDMGPKRQIYGFRRMLWWWLLLVLPGQYRPEHDHRRRRGQQRIPDLPLARSGNIRGGTTPASCERSMALPMRIWLRSYSNCLPQSKQTT